MNEFAQESTMLVAAVAVPSQAQPRAWDRRTWLVAIPLALIVIYAFIPTLNNGFLGGYDDDPNFRDNPYYRGLGLAQVNWAWTTFWVGVYQPLAWMLFGAQYTLWQLDPRGYHLTSVLLQAASAVALYFLTVALLVRCQPELCLKTPWTCSLSAGLATALFAVHPLRVEPVAWASSQPYLPCILFSMLSVLAYLRAFPISSPPRWGWLVGSFVLFVAAMLFKAVAMTVPAVLLILDIYPLRRFTDETGRWRGASTRRALLEKVSFMIVSLIFMRLAVAAKEDPRLPVVNFDATEGIAQACYGTWFYLWKTVIPLDPIISCPLPNELNWLALPYSLCILATLAMTAGLFLLRRRWPGLLAAWVSYLVILAPTSGLIRFSYQMVADRYCYLAMLGSVILAAAGFCWLWRMSSRWQPGAIGIVTMGLGALFVLTALTRNQCRAWLNSETLWNHALVHGPKDNPLAHFNLGVALQTRGNYEAAKPHFIEALRLYPGYVDAHNNLGAVLCAQGEYEGAKAHFTEALRLKPDKAKAHNNLGFVLFIQGKYKEAVARLTEALRLNPDDAGAHNNLGLVLSAQGKDNEAEAHLAEALRLEPDYDQAHNNLGKILSRRGKYEAAEAQFAAAVRLNPDFAEAHNNLGLALQTRGDHQAAEGQFREAIRLIPGLANAHYNLGITDVVRGKYEAAVAQFAEAIRLDPGFAAAHYNLGVVLFGLGNYGTARARFAEAARLQPGDPDAYSAGAILMAACPEARFRDGKGAVQFATRACELTKWRDPSCLNTLAAAQAEAGDFNTAVKWQKRAIDLLTDEGQKTDFRSRLVLYQTKKPYRQVPPRHAPSGARS